MINVDYINIDESELPLQPNGFLNIMANLTRTGVFTYMERTPDGTVRVIRQLRHPDEVFAESAMNTLMGLPVTNLHPEELVSPENAKELLVGMTSDTPKKIELDNDPESYVQQQVTFHDSESIGQIRDGQRTELSLGYVCELEDSPGEWNGVRYDYVQKNISYNHLSLVDRARGGAQCKVLKDSTDTVLNIQCDGLSLINDSLTGTEGDDMKVFIADGKEFKVEDSIYDLLQDMVANAAKSCATLDSKKSEMDKLQANFDDLKARFDKADGEEETAKQKAIFDAAVAATVSLHSKAKKVFDGVDLSKSEREIKEAVIKHKKPDLVLKDSDAYVDAMFDIVVDGHKEPMKEATLGNSLASNTDAVDGVTTVADARKKAWNRDRDLWKTKA